MKKTYIPTKYELLSLQTLKVDIYKYLLTKIIDALVLEDIVYKKRNMFETAYNRFPEFPEILLPLAKMYPERIKDCDRAASDIELCKKILKSSQGEDKSVYQLDNLSYFSQTKYDADLIKMVAGILSNKLTAMPKYRFDYQEPNILLDAIFSCSLPRPYLDADTITTLIATDPAYMAVHSDILQPGRKGNQSLITMNLVRYLNRYSLVNAPNYYSKQDIVNAPDEKVKKLIRYLDHYKYNYH